MRHLFSLLLLISSIGMINAQSNSENCPSDFTSYLMPRLVIGEEARVVFDIMLNLRPSPTINEARIAQLSGGTHFTVLEGPQCAEGFIWWQIETGDLNGWIAELNLSEDEYFVEPSGELILLEDEDGNIERYILTANDFLEPEGCLTPPDDYEQIQLGFATLNQRTLFMLDNAQHIYELEGGTWANFRLRITQGSYNLGGVSASFGTHDAGGAIDLSVIDTQDGWVIMHDEIMPMLRALRIAGFAAWLRDTNELFDGSIIHIHAIAIGDAEASDIARQQVNSEFGYLSGFNGLPPDEGEDPIPDIYGDPIICEWMIEAGFNDMRENESPNPAKK